MKQEDQRFSDMVNSIAKQKEALSGFNDKYKRHIKLNQEAVDLLLNSKIKI